MKDVLEMIDEKIAEIDERKERLKQEVECAKVMEKQRLMDCNGVVYKNTKYNSYGFAFDFTKTTKKGAIEYLTNGDGARMAVSILKPNVTTSYKENVYYITH